MLKKNKKIICMVTLLSFLTTSVGLSEVKTFATDSSIDVVLNDDNNWVIEDLTHGRIQEYAGSEGDLADSTEVGEVEGEEECISIEEALKLNSKEEATVTGIVSFNDRNLTLHIQDESGAIAISNNTSKINFSEVSKGDLVKVTGTRDTFKGLDQLQATEIEIVSSNNYLEPEVVSISDLKKGGYNSKYVEIENAVIDTSKKTLTQGDDVLDIYYIPSDINVKTGDTVNVKGTMGIYNTTIQIYGSSCTFTKVVTDDDKKGFVIDHTSVSKASIKNDFKIDAKVSGNTEDTVELSYKMADSADYTTVEMEKSSTNDYTYTIPKEELTESQLEYYITAKNQYVETSSDKYIVNITNEDITGPEIFNISPEQGSSVKLEALPQIYADLKDESGINTSTIKIFFNNEEVTSDAEITESYIKYTPENELKNGVHKVKIEVSDKIGNTSVKEWSFRKGELSHLFGQLHSHTNYSDGTGSLTEAYEWVKASGADYYAVTDHSNWFDNDTSANIADGSASSEWMEANQIANKYNEDDDFTAIYGYEMTWSGSTGGWGHINTFNTPGFETRSNKAMDLKKYYETLQTQPQSISQLNHPGKTFGDFADFAYYNEEIDKYVNLIEVGNGEGPIRGSGYFPSYEYYTRALDKGWHVAPTNNQDNHKGKWYTANNARTIIIAEDNSRESIYEAMRNKRVYASEDTNMTIDYTVNGEIMGSSLGETDKLNFKINVNDDDDTIKKISIIANGGVEVTSKEFNSGNVDWEFTLDPEYSYYYVKVVQADQDIAVTAPVWVGDSINVGLVEATVDNEVTLPGDKVGVTVGVYNNSSSEIKDINVDFYKNEISEENKLGTTKIDSVGSSETKNTTFNWTAESKGEYTIYAKAVINIDGKERVFTTSTKVKVANPEDTYRVLLDGAHYNQYISGDYAGKYTAFKSLLQDKNAITTVNTEPITDETLKNINILVLTNPQSTTNSTSELYPSKFSESEIAAIKRYVENGGNLILSTRADYKDGKGEYSNGTQMNAVLEAIGTDIRVNDDEVVDDTSNGGQNYRLYLNKYTSSKYDLVKGIENNTEEYSFYNGASVILAENASGENVDFLVHGHETTTTIDADNDNDNIPVEMGQVSVMAAEELASGGKVVVAGNTFFSDFEIDGTNGEKYSNIKVTNNIIDWMLPKKEIKKTNIADIRVDADNDGKPDLLGEEFVIEGYVTAQSEAVQPKNAFFEVVYIEDETGGICVFGISNTELKVGQKVRITGKVDEYQGEFELQISDEDTQLEILDENIKKINPTKISTKDSMLPINGGKLVEVQGKVVSMDESNLYIDDGTGISRVYVEGYIWDGINEDMKGKWDPSIKIGSRVSAIGLASMDPEGARLRVRNTGEIKLVKSSSSSSSNKKHETSNNQTSNENTQHGWVKDNNNLWSYVNVHGDKVKGWLLEGMHWYFMNEAGIMQTGWVNDKGDWYYLNENGSMRTGWVKSNEKWYYLSENGSMKTGWIKNNEKWYYLDESGAMKSGWHLDADGNWYYLDNDGSMKTGWFKDTNGKWYYLNSNGSMAFNTTINGYKLDNSGAWIC